MAYHNSPNPLPPRVPHVHNLFGVDVDINLIPSPVPSLERPPHNYSEHELDRGEARDEEVAIFSDSGGYYEVNMDVNSEDLWEEGITNIAVI